MSNLSDYKVLIFDVYGTLAVGISETHRDPSLKWVSQDWETGLYNALRPLLLKYPVSRPWGRKEALTAFGSVEVDLQAQYPNLLYSDLLAKAHEVLEERLKALGTSEPTGGSTSTTLAGKVAPSGAEVASSSGANTSADAGTSHSNAQTSVDADTHKRFGLSIPNWPIFPDTVDALQRLSKHFKLVVLSNVDRESFKYTHAHLSEGRPPLELDQTTLDAYTYPNPNPNKFWHPQETLAKSKSPFSFIITAQDTGCYKPATGGFIAVLQYLTAQLGLSENIDDLSLIKSKVLVVAQSLPHDHEPAHELGIQSVWIDRQSAVTCNETPGGPGASKKWTWRFETLGEMADAVERET